MDGTILIIDDVATNRIVLKAKLSAARYRPILASSGEDGLKLARTERPDLILTDLRLPDMSGVDLCRMLRQEPRTKSIPLIALTSSASVQDRLSAFSAGIDDIFPKPCPDDILLARVRNLLRMRQDLTELQEGRDDPGFELAEENVGFMPASVVAIVTDRKEAGIKLRHSLAPLMRDDFVVVSAAGAFRELDPGKPAPDLFLIDYERIEGKEQIRQLLSDLRSRASTRHAAICVVCPGANRDRIASMAFDLGVNDIIIQSMDGAEIAARLRSTLRRKNEADRLRVRVQNGLRLSVIDQVTGLHNRHYGLARLANLIRQQSETGLPLAVIVADLDRFKLVNDQYGHAAGDAVLVSVARRLSTQLRDGDLLARFGGEEFLIALPDTDLEASTGIAQRLRSSLAQSAHLLADNQEVEVTASFGLSMLERSSVKSREEADTIALDLIAQADQALLSAKATGRNRITVALRKVA